MTVSQALERLAAYEKQAFAYNHASGVLYYDGATVAPKGSADVRADTLGELSRMSYILTTAPETVEMLQTLGLQGREKHLPNQLSGGQQQRVSIGRALMNAPAVGLADEPTGNLDSKNSQDIVDLLKYSNRRFEQTLIVITHDESIALQADRILAIEDGKITRDEVIRR